MLVAVGQDVFSTRAAQHFMSLVSGDLFRALIPEQNLPVPSDHVHACLEIFQDGSKNAGIVYCNMQEAKTCTPAFPSAEDIWAFSNRIESCSF